MLAEDGSINLTPYHFAANNPIVFSDPSGLKVLPAWLAIPGAPQYIQNMWNATPSEGGTHWQNNGNGFDGYEIDFGGVGGGEAFSLTGTNGSIFGSIGNFIGTSNTNGVYDMAVVTNLAIVEVIGNINGNNRWDDNIVGKYSDIVYGNIVGPQSAGSEFGVVDGLRIAADFTPLIGPSWDIIEGINDGNGWQIAMGVGFLALDVVTLGSSSVIKGSVKTIAKQATKQYSKTAFKQIKGVVRASGKGVPNSAYSQLTKDGILVNKHFYDDLGNAVFEINYRDFNSIYGVHGHHFSIPGNLGSGHINGQHIPFMLIPSTYW